MGKISLDSYRADAEHFYTTDPDYRCDVAEMCRIIQRDIHDRVVAVDLEATLVSDVVDALYKSEEERVDIFDRLRRPLSDEMLQALVDANNRVILWTGMTANAAQAVLQSSRLILPQGARLVTREDYWFALSEEESGRQVLKRIIEVLGEPPSYSNPGGKTPDEYYSYVYANHMKIKILPVLGVDVLIDDQAFYHRAIGCERFFGPKEVAKFIDVEPFVIGSESTLAHYLRGDRGLLNVIRRLPHVLASIDRL